MRTGFASPNWNARTKLVVRIAARFAPPSFVGRGNPSPHPTPAALRAANGCLPDTGCWLLAGRGAGATRAPRPEPRRPQSTLVLGITRLKGPVKWTYFHLYPLAVFAAASSAMVAHRELAERLIQHTCESHVSGCRWPSMNPSRSRCCSPISGTHARPHLRRQRGGPVQDLEIPTGLPRPVRICDTPVSPCSLPPTSCGLVEPRLLDDAFSQDDKAVHTAPQLSGTKFGVV